MANTPSNQFFSLRPSTPEAQRIAEKHKGPLEFTPTSLLKVPINFKSRQKGVFLEFGEIANITDIACDVKYVLHPPPRFDITSTTNKSTGHTAISA